MSEPTSPSGPRPAPSAEPAAAELAAIADRIDDYHTRVGDLAAPFEGTDREDLAISIREAERSLRTAARSLQRAARAAR